MSVKGMVHLYAGDDEFAVRTAAGALVETLVPPADRAFGLEIVEGRADSKEEALGSSGRCLEAFATRGFLMAGAKVVWWRDVTFLADGTVAQSDEVKSKVKELVQMLRDAAPGGNILVITAPKVDKRSALFKLCSERFSVREFAVPEKSGEAVRYVQSVLHQELASLGLQAGQSVVQRFLERVGPDSRQIAGEVEKLFLYTGGRKNITEEDVDAIVSSSAESAMWDIQDAVGMRQLARGLRILRNLLDQRESPIGIATVIMNRLRDLQVYREGLDRGWLRVKSNGMAEWGDMEPDVEGQLTVTLKRGPRSLHPYRAGILARQAQLFTPSMLRRAQQVVMAAQESLVSSSVPPALLLEFMLTRLMTEGAAGAGARPAAGRARAVER